MNQAKYQELKRRMREVHVLGDIESLLDWDHKTYMPEPASDYRGEEIALLAGLGHERRTAREVGELLGELAADFTPDDLSPEAVNVREWRRQYDKSTKLPRELVEAISLTTTRANSAWVQARRAKDFKQFAPWLQKVVDLMRRKAECYGFTGEAYDALLDDYEPEAKTAEVAEVLNGLRQSAVPLLQAIKASSHKPDVSILKRDYPEAAQEAFAKEVAARIGFDFGQGRLDVTHHPFCSGMGPRDTRITTRYDRHYLPSALFGVMHEAGHGIYDQNLPEEHYGTPAGESVSLGIHESQSRLWENQVGRSRAFWDYWYPTAQKHFPTLGDVAMDDFQFAINKVEPSYIRVEADELTYNLHILLRFEIERALLNDDLKIADTPTAWNEKFESYFGIPVPDDSQGCLQDVHWSLGYIGYFPTYSLGNLNAAQIFAKAHQELGDLEEMFRRGEFAPLKAWLTEKIHSQGRRYPSAKLTEVVTGEKLNSTALMTYMKEKFGKLYNL